MKKNLSQISNQLLSENDLADESNFTTFLNSVSDIASTQSLSKQAITHSGIHNQKAIIYIKNFEDGNEYIPVFCEINIGVDVKDYRGVHMSRYSQNLFELANEKFDDLDIFTEKLAKVVREKQESNISNVEVVGTYIHKKLTKKSNLLSYDSMYLISNAISTKDKTSVQTGIKVYNMTACPCTKSYTKYMIAPELKAMGLSTQQINDILKITMPATHTQRGTTTLLINKEDSTINHKDLYNILEESTHLIYDLLKRPDEHDLVIRAVQRPQFTEDVAREVADNAYKQFKDSLSSNAEIYVESILNDAIHIHDVRTVIKKTFGEIQKEIE